MPILDLDKIIFKKPSTGIYCLECGGDFKKIDKKITFVRILGAITFGWFKGRHYQCENCKKKYLVV